MTENAHMTATRISTEPGQRIVLSNISWDLYERLLEAHLSRSVPRFTYDKGDLEIMSPSDQHEQLTDAVRHLVHIVAEVMRINMKGYGSTTFRRRDINRGFEPDACFYSKKLHRVLGKKSKLDLRKDPPPDLVVEIDLGRSSINKESIMAQFGVSELWRYRRRSWRILVLGPAGYREQEESSVLPGLTQTLITTLIEESRTLEPLVWNKRVRRAALRLKKDSN
jgi:Uma2 family endonuclease